jgi:hypothetical protein
MISTACAAAQAGGLLTDLRNALIPQQAFRGRGHSHPRESLKAGQSYQKLVILIITCVVHLETGLISPI